MANLNHEKPGQYRPSDEDFKAGFEENMRFFQSFFLKSDNKLIAWSFDSQLQFNCQQIHCMKSGFLFGWTEEQMYLPL